MTTPQTDPLSRPVAFVTGGTGGIGAATCRALARDGHDVVLTYHSNTAKAEQLVSELESAGARAEAVRLDLTDAEAVTVEVERVVADLGDLKTVVHASGPFVDQIYISQLEPAKFTSHVDAELNAFFHVVRASLPSLRRTAGSITAVTSVAVRRFPVKDILSGAPKGGIEVIVRGVAREEGKFGIRANSVAPGVVEDAMGVALIESGNFDPASIEITKRLTPLQRFGLSHEIAEVVAFLASDRASYVSGQTIDVDGGYNT
ncbi:SDR family oxidoreductase [Nocardioides sp. Y6]|uniref:SDR family oxidoreductase n=1 Tax=Nocardioides malaquae TaxID=2773426 RepID=A0ABR9RT43_9ACTN|nr:SDR family oxidoreductase [Nocardioides malaquae]MBE7324748.1 SDR family oxidoreductase [Nocardioides malaquae]